MSHFYTTKALGREWRPSPIRSNSSSKGRYGTWPLDPPILRWSYESPTPPPNPSPFRWSRAHERILLAAGVLAAVMWWFGSANPIRMSWEVSSQTVTADVEWSSFAYATYATDVEYLCSAVMMIKRLGELGVRAERMILYDEAWDSYHQEKAEQKLLRKAREEFGAKLQAVNIQNESTKQTWANGFTKLLAFNQTQYKRILALDADGTVLQAMDELFLLPEVDIAMPRAYWRQPGDERPELSNAVILVAPSTSNYDKVQSAMTNSIDNNNDTEIMNRAFQSPALALPHRPYILQSGEFRIEEHGAYLGEGEWDAKKAIQEAKYVHFSESGSESAMPDCKTSVHGSSVTTDCSDREVWDWLHEDFRSRGVDVCGD